MLYEPRESINPRTFALRHALLEELKRRQGLLRGDVGREPLVALARALDVGYDASTRRYLVRGGDVMVEVPLDAFRCYVPRTDASSGHWEQEDEILRANRALTSGLIDRLLAAPPRHAAP
jgi:hypothetical protein